MKKFLLIIILSMVVSIVVAQVPNFGTTAGHLNLYGYSSMKYRVNAGKNGMADWTTYSTLQLGVTDYMNLGVDMFTSGKDTYIGYTARAGVKTSKWFSVGVQFTPSFNLSDQHKFSYMTSALYMNGDITRDGRLFWVTDTWLEQDKNSLTSAKQWTYLGYTFALPGKDNSITPIGGMIHSWKFDENPDLSLGCYYTHNKVSVYAWANDICTDYPRFVLAFEFKFNVK